MQYYISRAGATYGPYPEEEVRRMLGEGRVVATDLCWTEGMAGWQPVGQVFGAAPPPVPPPVPPPQPAAAPPVVAGAGGQAPPAMAPQPQPPAAAWAGGAAAWPGAAAGPFPPDLHWLLVLLLTWITCGIFGYVWLFVEAHFVKKIHPGSPARMLFALYLAIVLASTAVLFLASPGAGSEAAGPAAFSVPGFLAATVLFFAGVFSMRRSLLHHYNTAENIGLRLNPVLTFLFNILYFQYHFSRIARWKRTGMLD